MIVQIAFFGEGKEKGNEREGGKREGKGNWYHRKRPFVQLLMLLS